MTRPPRQARAEKTRARILAAALDLLVTAGPGAVTHRAVSQAAGVSLGSTTYYFGSKADLLEEVYRAHLAAVRERAEATLETYRDGSLESPRAVGSRRTAAALVHYLERDLREGRKGALASFELALVRARDPVLRRRLRPAGRASMRFAADMLREIGSQNPEMDSQLLIAALTGLKLEWLAEGERSAFAGRLPGLLERLAEVLLPSGSSPREDD